MEAFFMDLLNTFIDYISRYSYFISRNYYGSLVEKYFSGEGFILGLIFVLIVYCSTAKGQGIAGFFKVLSIIAVINSCVVLSNYLNTVFNQELSYIGNESMFNAPDNIISGFILTLVISSCYRGSGRRAFLFGIVTHATLPFLNFTLIENMDEFARNLMIMRIALAGFLCLILSYRKYFYTSWIWYFCFHMFLRIFVFLYPKISELVEIDTFSEFQYIVGLTLEYLSHYIVDVIIFGIVLVFAIIFEKGILPLGNAQKTT